MEDLESEQWKAVEGYPGYEVSIARADKFRSLFLPVFMGNSHFRG